MGQHRHDNMAQGAKVGEDVEGGKEVVEAVEVNPPGMCRAASRSRLDGYQ